MLSACGGFTVSAGLNMPLHHEPTSAARKVKRREQTYLSPTTA